MLPGNFPNLANLIFGAGNPLALFPLDSSSESDSSEDMDDTEDDFDAFVDIVNPLEGLRLPRSCVTYHHDGDMLANCDGTSPDATKHWNALRDAAYEERWMMEFRMNEATFGELLQLVQPHLQESRVYRDGRRSYSKRHRLLLTLSFLAHVPTMRYMSLKLGVPQNTISSLILRKTILALKYVLIQDPLTKEIKFPSTEAEVRGVMQGFSEKYGLPCVLGAIDGSLIPMRKPTREQTGGDRDAYWCYKGHIASLLLSIVDVNGLFLYASAGAPGCMGDAGLWATAELKTQLDNGAYPYGEMLECGNEAQFVQGYLVGDAAFALSKTMLKCHDGAPLEDTPDGKFNRAIINSRRAVECTFGRLKARFAFCNRNTFWANPTVTRDAVQVCCGLHNFLQKRSVGIPDEVHVPGGGLGQVHVELGEAQAIAGATVRDFITDWLSQPRL